MQTEARFKELLEEQRQSGLSIIEFCSNHGIVPSTFHYWKKKLTGKPPVHDFIPLVVKPPEVAVTPGATMSDLPPSGNESLLELVYPNGVIVRIKREVDLPHLRSLIHLYD